MHEQLVMLRYKNFINTRTRIEYLLRSSMYLPCIRTYTFLYHLK